jgi:hypothetical protein
MPDTDFPILPSTKVAALLERYPELEAVLIGLAPPFKKLKNPILRRSVARIASLEHAAAVGRIPVVELVNRLREAAGQAALAPEACGDAASYFTSQPAWFDAGKIKASIEERLSDPHKMPVTQLLEAAARLAPGEIVELITTFIPAPGIEVMKKKGFLVWSAMENPELIRTYVTRPGHS